MSQSFIFSGLNVYAESGLLKNAYVEVVDGVIKSIHAKPMSSETVPLFPSNYSLVPGFIDLHVHGADGQDVMDANTEALQKMSAALAREGVTGFLATTMTDSLQQIEKTLCCVRDFMQRPHHHGANILGVHLEGPFLAAEKTGAQSAKKLLPLTVETIAHWQQLSPQMIKLVTLAPELPDSDSFIRYLKQQGIIASIGHSNATYAECLKAISDGCSHVTHLFNAMRGLHQREPGVVGAALLSEQVSAEIIVDGIHVHPAMVKMALALKGNDKIVLVTDAMRAKCLSDGNYELGGQTVEVKNHIARLSDGTLAGSTLKMNNAIKNIMHYTQCDLGDAVKMAAFNPAKILNLSQRKGGIAIGKDADLVVLDEQLNVVLTMVRGEVVYKTALERMSSSLSVRV